jgi:hypothetical protein
VVPEFCRRRNGRKLDAGGGQSLTIDTVDARAGSRALFGRFAEQLNVDTERLASAAVVAELQAS